MRNMSFSMTTEQVRNKTKTVTRRFGWWSLKPGTKLWAIEKGQGLKKGQKVKRICKIEVVSVREEMPKEITYTDCILEGFPALETDEFVRMLCKSSGRSQYDAVNRIEFKYL